MRVLWFSSNPQEWKQCEQNRPSDISMLPVQGSAEAFSYLTNGDYDVVLAQLPLGQLSAEELLQKTQKIDRTLPVVICLSEADVTEAVRLTKLGASYVLASSTPNAALWDTLRSAAALNQAKVAERLRTEGQEPWRRLLIGDSPAMRRVAEVIRLIAARRSTVLITGETGTGKEVAARAIHSASGRDRQSMVAVNCSAIPENLLEAELFGHVKGAFTGATQGRAGRFEQANEGTIFLDEIGDLPLDLQAKLLRVLQEKEVQRLGSSETIKLDVRVIAATNLNLEDEVKHKRFRQDLFYRLNVVPLQLPALRERKDDIATLAQHFVEKVCLVEGLAQKRLSREVSLALSQFDWPGNVRQLEHAVEMAVVLSGIREQLLPGDFPSCAPHAVSPVRESDNHVIELPAEGLDFDETVSRVERSILEQALSRANGNKARAADLLRMKRTTLLAKMKTLQFGSAAAVCA